MTDKPALTAMRDALANGEFPQFDIRDCATCFYALSAHLGVRWLYPFEIVSGGYDSALTMPEGWEWAEPGTYSRERCILALDRLIAGEPCTPAIWRPDELADLKASAEQANESRAAEYAEDK